jgi:uncharacterized membrane protein
MTGWRDRLDRTTNWAIGAVAAMLSVALASPAAHHGMLIFAMLLVLLLLSIESRRYRFFDVYRTRVRLLERHYFSRYFDPRQPGPPTDWAARLGESLRSPSFDISMRQALARRLRRQYIWMFLILLFAWLLKTTTAELAPQQGQAVFVHSLDELLTNMAVAYIPGWLVLAGVGLLYGWLVFLMIRHLTIEGELSYGAAHV